MDAGYKVVRKLNDTEYGPVTYDACREVRYRLGQVTVQDKEKFGPMSVFNSLLRSQKFAKDMSHLPGLTVFKVKYEQSNEEMLWKKESKTTKTKGLSSCPPGTVLASSVMLDGEVIAE